MVGGESAANDRRALLDRHLPPAPESCDVCKYAIEHELDIESEHARTRTATMILLVDLAELEHPARMSSLATTTFPPVGDVVHAIEPRHWHWHWHWALLHEPELVVGLRRFQDDA